MPQALDTEGLSSRTDHDSPADITSLYRAHLSRGRAKIGEMFGGQIEASSAGTVVRTSDGREYLNCGGYGVFLAGACHPRVVAAVERQIHTHPLSTRLLLEPSAAHAAAALIRVAPTGLEHVHFTGSGAEAVETALKMARSLGHRRLIAMANGFHGKTLGALSVTGKPLYQDPFRPLLPDTSHVPFGDVAALEAELSDGGSDACVIVEPVQGEAGVVIPPDGYLKQVEELCRRTGAFLIVDEVMTGLGRLGTWWGADRERVVPDVLLVGKALSGGVIPVAAAVATPAAFAAFDRDPFLHTSTFSAAPVAMAAARAAIELIEEENLVDTANRLGSRLLSLLTGVLRAHCPHLVADVRGRGLLIAVEFHDAGLVGEFILDLLDHGVVVNHSLNAHAVVRFTPPAVFGESDVERLETAVTAAARALAHRFPEAPPAPSAPSDK
ncbi:aminotransferase class III-fold pyridoxal phosphate-dependent enzyme [Streptomyces sp. AV19]|uniref:aspartate aminotransferase family protein n=1 Tax=Streptomyces sp. AV19 TaxID=2793068 RepID=UPI001F246C1D|nr:aminotransferase class III-fold pyridoxal phosphate-dependent enzyme [Streptomyces sp. AV19]MDG4535706.1 aminotransferase class III-fold pyridoxal phosphate-dependent enzyme [Streptomyces sp. AV19]